ncbi:unnamed protein product [Alopecurus aequalis]
MADIENLLPSSSAARAEPSRHGFWAWRERFVLAHLTAYNPDNAADAVARVDGDQRSRVRFLCWCTLLDLLAMVGFSLLLAIKPSTADPRCTTRRSPSGSLAWPSRRSWGSFLFHLWTSVIVGNRDDQRIIDSLM